MRSACCSCAPGATTEASYFFQAVSAAWNRGDPVVDGDGTRREEIRLLRDTGRHTHRGHPCGTRRLDVTRVVADAEAVRRRDAESLAAQEHPFGCGLDVIESIATDDGLEAGGHAAVLENVADDPLRVRTHDAGAEPERRQSAQHLRRAVEELHLADPHSLELRENLGDLRLRPQQHVGFEVVASGDVSVQAEATTRCAVEMIFGNTVRHVALAHERKRLSPLHEIPERRQGAIEIENESLEIRREHDPTYTKASPSGYSASGRCTACFAESCEEYSQNRSTRIGPARKSPF